MTMTQLKVKCLACAEPEEQVWYRDATHCKELMIHPKIEIWHRIRWGTNCCCRVLIDSQ